MTNTYYDYKKHDIMAVKIQTRDPLFDKKGNGVYRNDGATMGVSLSNGELSEYYPFEGLDLTQEDAYKNFYYIQQQLSGSNRKLFAGCQYELDWLQNHCHIPVKGTWEDVQIAEPILDEYKKSYALDALAKDYLNYVQPALSTKTLTMEARLIYSIFIRQEKILKEQDLWEIYRLEMDGIPLLLQMRKTGVRIDKDQLYKTGLALEELSYSLQKELNQAAGFKVDPGSSHSMERLFDCLDLPVTYNQPTPAMRAKGLIKGNPTFKKTVLVAQNNVLVNTVLDLRKANTLKSMYIKPYGSLLVRDRIHCNLHPLKSDKGGTVSGRFSSSLPNLQGVDSHDFFLLSRTIENLVGLIIRKLFLPEENCYWAKLDWSQIEYRFLAHYAIGPGAEALRARYQKDSSADFHRALCQMTGINDRDKMKTLNLAGVYGQGVASMAREYGWDLDEAKVIYDLYHKKSPFIKITGERISAKARKVGFIKTILGRKARLRSPNEAYKTPNRLFQGSAADLMKKAMNEAYEAGIYNTLHPHLTVHDELDQSVPRTKEGTEALTELKEIMETCVKLRVPIIAKLDTGENWGELEENNG